MTPPRVAFFGSSEFSARILTSLDEFGWQVVLVVSQPDQPRGRGRQVTPTAVSQLATRHGWPLSAPASVRDVADSLAASQPDLAVIAAYGQILPPEILRIPRHGCLNVHASLLPAYRGAAPIQQAIIDGCQQTGVTLMLMDTGVDTGPLLASVPVTIRPDDTAGSLSERLAAAAGPLLNQTVPSYLAGTIHPAPQPNRGISHTHMLTKEDGRIDWQQPAERISRQVRAMQPWPGAWTTLDDTRVKIIDAQAVTANSSRAGEFTVAAPLVVGTGRGRLQINRLQPAGKPERRAADWLAGRRHPGRFN